MIKFQWSNERSFEISLILVWSINNLFKIRAAHRQLMGLSWSLVCDLRQSFIAFRKMKGFIFFCPFIFLSFFFIFARKEEKKEKRKDKEEKISRTIFFFSDITTKHNVTICFNVDYYLRNEQIFALKYIKKINK